MEKEDLVSRYEFERETYDSFAQTLNNLLKRLLASEGIELHSVSHRCKTLSSLRGKIDKKGSYDELDQITDLAGIRLITHYEDDVDKVAQVIESEFLVDAENSIDKRKALDPDRFGYLSLHYVLSLKPDRASLREYSNFSKMKAEIQVRSILQHTWAEIEHDTGYKSDVEVPKHIRRRFSRLAGLLELADQEFIGIRDALQQYSLDVTAQVETASEKKDDGESVDTLIDKISLLKFLELDPLVLELDNKICEILGGSRSPNVEYALSDIGRLKLLGINTLGELKRSLVIKKDFVLRRATMVAQAGTIKPEGEKNTGVRYGISILYLVQVLISQSGGVEEVERLLLKANFKPSPALLKSLCDLSN